MPIVVDHLRLRMLQQLLVSTLFNYIALAHNYSVEMPLQNPLDGLPRCSSVSNASKPDKPVRSEVSDSRDDRIAVTAPEPLLQG